MSGKDLSDIISILSIYGEVEVEGIDGSLWLKVKDFSWYSIIELDKCGLESLGVMHDPFDGMRVFT